MDLREQETAAAVQDLEIRQIELENQRKLLEQVNRCRPALAPSLPVGDHRPQRCLTGHAASRRAVQGEVGFPGASCVSISGVCRSC